jgi:hypothetical protein
MQNKNLKTLWKIYLLNYKTIKHEFYLKIIDNNYIK